MGKCFKCGNETQNQYEYYSANILDCKHLSTGELNGSPPVYVIHLITYGNFEKHQGFLCSQHRGNLNSETLSNLLKKKKSSDFQSTTVNEITNAEGIVTDRLIVTTYKESSIFNVTYSPIKKMKNLEREYFIPETFEHMKKTNVRFLNINN